MYSWTNPGAGSIGCCVHCALALIQDNVIIVGDVVTDEEAFKQAVADDLGVAVEDLTLVQG